MHSILGSAQLLKEVYISKEQISRGLKFGSHKLVNVSMFISILSMQGHQYYQNVLS